MKSRLRAPLLSTLLLSCTFASGRATAPPVVEQGSSDRTTSEVPVPFEHSHTAWNEILGKHVRGDRFDYGALARDRAALDGYVAELRAVTPGQLEGWSREQRFAFWINVYNAFTIQKVVDNYPLDSIKDLSKFFGAKSVFDSEFIPLRAHHPEGDDDDLSLNDVEHGILRARFPDARVHAAINCASESCPPLRGEAFVAERLDEQLEEQMRAFVNDPRRNQLDAENGRLRLSKIFDWFEEDFERDAGSVREFVLGYVPEGRRPLIREARITHLDYSWDLNDTRSDS